jgi:serine phosphatase RsbU (regulator of sigma subunit)
MGHGPEAAAVMAQLRAAAHALADLDLEPADLLERLNRVTATLQRITLATCAYAVVDTDGHSCTLAGAGHLPPILALPDGTTRVPELPAGQSLGLGTAVYGQARIKLPPGAVLALYTDGLVESRTRSFDRPPHLIGHLYHRAPGGALVSRRGRRPPPGAAGAWDPGGNRSGWRSAEIHPWQGFRL